MDNIPQMTISTPKYREKEAREGEREKGRERIAREWREGERGMLLNEIAEGQTDYSRQEQNALMRKGWRRRVWRCSAFSKMPQQHLDKQRREKYI